MVRSSQEYKAYWILRQLTPAELQAYVLIETPRKVGRKYEAPIVSDRKVIRSTKIPASTIARFQSGEFTPRERSIRKLAVFYDKYMYFALRARGANKHDANAFRSYAPDRIRKVFSKYDKWTAQISRNYERVGKEVPVEYIKWGMAHSRHTANEWDMISKISGLKKHRPRKPKRARKYEH